MDGVPSSSAPPGHDIEAYWRDARSWVNNCDSAEIELPHEVKSRRNSDESRRCHSVDGWSDDTDSNISSDDDSDGNADEVTTPGAPFLLKSYTTHALKDFKDFWAHVNLDDSSLLADEGEPLALLETNPPSEDYQSRDKPMHWRQLRAALQDLRKMSPRLNVQVAKNVVDDASSGSSSPVMDQRRM